MRLKSTLAILSAGIIALAAYGCGKSEANAYDGAPFRRLKYLGDYKTSPAVSCFADYCVVCGSDSGDAKCVRINPQSLPLAF